MISRSLDYSEIRGIKGWLAPLDFYIIKELIIGQSNRGNDGSICEIGVHHGKSFIPMSIYSDPAKCYCIDLFSNQSLNIDNSGKGDYRLFVSNLKKFNIDRSRIYIDENLSTQVQPSTIIDFCGEVRFSHIDGGHNYSVVKKDIKLALSVVNLNSIIAIDDCYRPEWPEVSMAIFRSSDLKKKEFIPFAIGFNKIYLCHKKMFESYQEIIMSSKVISSQFHKSYEMEENKGFKVFIFSTLYVPEWGLGSYVLNFFRIHFLNFYSFSINLLRKFKKLKYIIK